MMPDTPIDLSEGVQSVRLKVPTADVPIPPEGFAQLHSPAPGELALRLPDGSVVPIGGGGGGFSDTLVGSGGIITAAAGNGPANAGLSLLVGAGLGIYASGPFIGASGLPLGAQVATVAVSSAELLALHITPKVLVPAPAAGRIVVLVSVAARFRAGDTPYTTVDDTRSIEFGFTTDPADPDNEFFPLVLSRLTGGDFTQVVGGISGSPQAFVGQPFACKINDPSSPLVGGNGALEVTTVYYVV